MTEIKIDREKVIEGLEEVVHDFAEEVEEWGRFTPDELRGGVTVDCDWFYGVLTKCKNALALLKAEEQKPISASIVDSDGGLMHWWACGNCQAPINPEDRFCHECGKAVAWE